MNRVDLSLFSLFFLFSLSGCSNLNLEIDSDSMVRDNYGEMILPAQESSSLYYYYQGEKVFVNERKDLVALQFNDHASKEEFLSGLSSVSLLKEYSPDSDNYFPDSNLLNIVVLQSTHGFDGITDNYLREMRSRGDIVYVSYPLERHGHLAVMMSEFAVKIHSKSDYQKLEHLANQFECEVFQRKIFSSDVFFIRCSKDSEIDAIRIADCFYETGLFDFAAPDFFLPDVSFSYDPMYPYQWGLKHTGQYGTSGFDINVESAWNITEGSEDIIIAIVDDGVELSHSDLAGNLVPGYNASDGLPGGGPISDDYHGTAVAGIAAAIKNNNDCISGVAPGCKIMPIRKDGTFWQAAAGIRIAKEHGADVINCSWGSTDFTNDLLTAEINSAALAGREGKGCVIVAAVGNSNGNVAFPANLSKVIGVGAYSIDGNRKAPSSPDGESDWGSNYGAGLSVVAPGVNIVTTGRQSLPIWFGGTSAAAPFVSGIAALLLSEYPDLTREQVENALFLSSTIPSGYSHSSYYHYPYTFYYNSEVGHGRVDAYYALQIGYLLHYQNINDATSGFDVTVMNNTSYLIEGLEVELRGVIGGNTVTLFSESMGDLVSGNEIGYPVFRGPGLNLFTPGITISNVRLEIWAQCPDDVTDGIRIAAQLENPYPTNFEVFSFGDGDFYERTISNTTVPDGSRRRLYINILYN